MYSKEDSAMKKTILAIAAFAGLMASAGAQDVSGLRIIKNGDRMNVDMNIDLADLDVKKRRSVHIIPVLKNGADSLELSPVGIYGKGRYISYLRNGESVLEELGETVYKNGDQPSLLEYATSVKYQPWMDGSEIMLKTRTCGCCNDLKDEDYAALGGFEIPVFNPAFIYIQPAPELVKMRELSGEAFIEFVVARTDIRPDYRGNRAELDKIIATIDSVRNDSDISIKHIYLKGYASPESPYRNNERLAKGRTAALKEYVQDLYHINDTTIRTSYEPENWAGLKAYVEEAQYLPERSKILDIIDSDLEPDPKEWKIKKEYPEQYAMLLANCYPALRKTDYRIEYSIADYTDLDKILEIFRTSPNKLSLNELYIASTAFEPGSEDYNQVFETAVRMYPEDPIANLNAANVAIASGDYKAARRHLNKADADAAQTVYTWGLYYIATGEYDKAEEALTQARAAGIAEADAMLEQCAKLKKYHSENK